MYTVGEAAQVVGLTRQAIVKAIKSGRLSASRGEGGRWAIDPAELSRVYKVARQPMTTSLRSLSPVAPVDDSLLRAELDKWRLLATEREETIRDLRQQRDRAQAALDAAEARLDRLLLTDQRTTAPAPARRSWWRWGRRA